jgi:hypothetical protein
MFEAPVSTTEAALILSVEKSNFCSTAERLVMFPARLRSLPPSVNCPAVAPNVIPVELNPGKSLFGRRLTVPSNVSDESSVGAASPTQLVAVPQSALGVPPPSQTNCAFEVACDASAVTMDPARATRHVTRGFVLCLLHDYQKRTLLSDEQGFAHRTRWLNVLRDGRAGPNPRQNIDPTLLFPSKGLIRITYCAPTDAHSRRGNTVA